MKLYFIHLVCLPCILIANCLQGTNNSMSFSKDSRIVGKTCPDNKVFSAQNIQSMFVCATMCNQDYTCASFFFSSSTGRCDGCKLVYSNDSGLTDEMEDSLYYKRVVKHSYLGCAWWDNNFCAYKGISRSTDMTVEWCANYCKPTIDTYPLFALLLGINCYCGQLCNGEVFVPENYCNVTCAGDPNQICGSGYSQGYFVSVYRYA